MAGELRVPVSPGAFTAEDGEVYAPATQRERAFMEAAAHWPILARRYADALRALVEATEPYVDEDEASPREEMTGLWFRRYDRLRAARKRALEMLAAVPPAPEGERKESVVAGEAYRSGWEAGFARALERAPEGAVPEAEGARALMLTEQEAHFVYYLAEREMGTDADRSALLLKRKAWAVVEAFRAGRPGQTGHEAREHDWRPVPCGHPQDPVANVVEEGYACHCGWLLDPSDARPVKPSEAPGPVVPCWKCGCVVALPVGANPEEGR